MTKEYKSSLSLNLTKFQGTEFKILCDTVRSGVKQEHGFRALKNLTDHRFSSWSIVIRFATRENRNHFIQYLKNLLAHSIYRKMEIKKLIPKGNRLRPTRFLKSA